MVEEIMGRLHMWTHQVEQLDRQEGQKYRLLRGAEPVPYSEVLTLWQQDPAFLNCFIDLLVNSPYSAYRWETPPLTKATQDRPFEFVLLDCPGLDRQPDAESFSKQFGTAKGADVLRFPNLGGDAVMVVPCPIADPTAYVHLAAFVRTAPRQQVEHLWQVVGEGMAERMSDKPVWLSTAGMGVSWLHVRLDSRPKYYGYAPYTRVG